MSVAVESITYRAITIYHCGGADRFSGQTLAQQGTKFDIFVGVSLVYISCKTVDSMYWNRMKVQWTKCASNLGTRFQVQFPLYLFPDDRLMIN